jgi:SpoIID/LytB domain protein
MDVTRFALGALLVLSSAACVSAPIAPATPTPAAARPKLVKVQISEGGVIVVREVPLEDYVQATAISEVAPAAGDVSLVERMLEVQTIVSRTYAVSNLGRHAQEGFDLCSTTHCQLYDPQRLQTSKWAAASSQAIRQTSGTIVTFGNQPVQALFHADCGGYTSTAGSVWGGSDRPYLAARPDQGSAADAHAAWQYDVTVEALARALNADPRTRLERPLETIEVIDRDAAGRANRIALGSRSARPGTTTAPLVIRGDEFRQVLSRAFGARAIRSTLFDVRRTGATFTFSGRGYGHGVGLCQAGALARLRAGAPPSGNHRHGLYGPLLKPGRPRRQLVGALRHLGCRPLQRSLGDRFGLRRAAGETKALTAAGVVPPAPLCGPWTAIARQAR